jgi:hypothetical protein
MSKSGFKDINIAATDPNKEQFAPTEAQPIRQRARMAGDPIAKIFGMLVGKPKAPPKEEAPAPAPVPEKKEESAPVSKSLSRKSAREIEKY